MMGIDVNRTIGFVFLLAGALAGAAGVLFAFYFQTIRYDTGFTIGLIAFTAAVLGGIGNLPGAVLGALLIGLIQAFVEGLSWHSPGAGLDDDDRVHDPDRDPRLPARGAARRADARGRVTWRAERAERVQRGFWRALEAVGVEDARAALGGAVAVPAAGRAAARDRRARAPARVGAGRAAAPDAARSPRDRVRPLPAAAARSADRSAADGAGRSPSPTRSCGRTS